jgi:hAT family C-terminal dimerisation region
MEEKNSDDTIVYTNPLDWCKRHSHLRLLSSVAKRILCVPATSASSEIVFSDAGNVITEDRTRLTPDTASALVLLKHWDTIEDMLKSHL